MQRIQFKLSTLLMLLTVLAVAIGLSYQFHLLRQQVAQLNTELQGLKRTQPRVIAVYPPAAASQNTRFRLLNTELIVDPATEDGMKAGEWELQQRLQRRLRDEEKAPIRFVPDLESRTP